MGWAARARQAGAARSWFDEQTTVEARTMRRLVQRTTLPERMGLLARTSLAVGARKLSQRKTRALPQASV